MLWKSTPFFLLLLISITIAMPAAAQSLRGKVIYVSPSQEVKLKFRSNVENYSFVNKNESSFFKTKVTGSRNVMINSVGPNFRASNLVITEGENTHLFILAYKNSLDAAETVYDFSSKDKLQSEAQRLAAKGVPAKQGYVKQAPEQPVTPPVTLTTDRPEVPVQPTASAVIASASNVDATAPPVIKVSSNTDVAVQPTATTTKKEWKSDGPVYRTTTKPVANTEYKSNGPLYRTKSNSSSGYKSDGPLYRPSTKSGASSKSNPAPEQHGGNAVTDDATLIFNDYNIDSIKYEVFIHLADSIAWTLKEYKRALPWYDSAQRVRPQSSYPAKQIKAIRHLQYEKDISDAKKTRSASFAVALEDYKKADRLRIERKYEESYKGYKAFLSQIDSNNLSAYNSYDLYYINQAKDFVVRLEPHLPKPTIEAAPAPVVSEGKKKRKKRNF
jgi:hypothetical protein